MESDNAIIKVLALIDRRVGKRMLSTIKNSIENESKLVRYFYQLRYEAGEKVFWNNGGADIETIKR